MVGAIDINMTHIVGCINIVRSGKTSMLTIINFITDNICCQNKIFGKQFFELVAIVG